MPRQPFRPPSRQGRHDGMCGLYAILNAAKYVYPNMRNTHVAGVFRTSAMAVPELWPGALWEGTTLTDVRKMLASVAKYVDDKHPRYKFAVTEPFRLRAPDNTDLYFTQVREMLSQSNSALILGLGAPWDHWTVVRDVTDRAVWFLDSYGIDTMRIADLTFDKRDANRVKVDRHQAFLVRRIARA